MLHPHVTRAFMPTASDDHQHVTRQYLLLLKVSHQNSVPDIVWSKDQ